MYEKELQTGLCQCVLPPVDSPLRAGDSVRGQGGGWRRHLLPRWYQDLRRPVGPRLLQVIEIIQIDNRFLNMQNKEHRCTRPRSVRKCPTGDRGGSDLCYDSWSER